MNNDKLGRLDSDKSLSFQLTIEKSCESPISIPRILQYINDTKKKTKCKSVSDCPCTNRIIMVLKYYHSVESINDSLINVLKSYSFLLDDFHHIIDVHNNEECLTKISRLLGNCNKQCTILKRYINRDRNKIHHEEKQNNVQDEKHIFYRDTFDNIHCYLQHLYCLGLRVTTEIKSVRPKLGKHKFKRAQSKYLKDDHEFSNICANVKRSKTTMRNLFRSNQIIETFRADRFNIPTVVCHPTKDVFDLQDNVIDDEKHENGTFIDKLYEYLATQCISDECIRKVQYAISQEQYDTETLFDDSITDDIIEDIVSTLSFNRNRCFDVIKECIKNTKLEDTSFHIGYIFYYWEYYKHLEEHQHHYTNINDHLGFEPHQLYVKATYKSIKEEILQNKMYPLTNSDWQNAVNKAAQYISTKAAKKIKASHVDAWFHYGIKGGTSLSEKHLLSLIFYCDKTELCTVFSSTFRKTYAHQKIKTVKNQNAEFANWSRLLRETIEYFGDDGEEFSGRVCTGPWYCGMSKVLYIPEFCIRLCGPTSTSKKLEVATIYGKTDGMIMQLNNTGDNDIQSKLLKSFDCCWLSNYNGEDEYLFCGGAVRIKVETVRMMDTPENFEHYFTALFYFDCMISGIYMSTDKIHVTEAHYAILKDLINYKLKIGLLNDEHPKYIHDTFEQFINHKKQITLNLCFLHKWFKQRNLKDLIIKDSSVKEFNLPQDCLFKLFKNLDHVIIYSTTTDNRITNIQQYEQYVFNLFSVSEICKSMFCQNKNFRISVKAMHRLDTKRSWIYDQYITVQNNPYYFYTTIDTVLKKNGNQDCLTFSRKN